MENSRIDKSIKNIKASFAVQIIGLLVNFITRRIFVQLLSAEYLGLSGLFSNILSMLSLAELGIGTAITFSLYKPLSENDNDKICALMQMFRRAYTYIGAVVLLLGTGFTPFLHYLIKDMPDIPHLRAIYLLYVLNSGLSYFFSYKQALIIADQKRYIVNIYNCVINIVQHLLQIAVLFLTRDYIAYLITYIVCTLLLNILLARKADRLYPYLGTRERTELSVDDRGALWKNVRAMISHKIGGVVVLGTDNILMTRLVGLAAVGLYSNYLLITTMLNGVYNLIYTSVVASIGNLGATADSEQKERVFLRLDFFSSWLFGFSSVCLVTLFNPFITFWLGEQYCFPMSTVILISLNFYLTGMRKACLTFREALGLYWYDRKKPIFEAAINLFVSIWLGVRYGVNGILIGTAVSTLLACTWIEPFVLYRFGFEKNAASYFKKYITFTILTIITGIVTYYACSLIRNTRIYWLALKFLICAMIPNLIYYLSLHRKEEYLFYIELLEKMIKKERNSRACE